eukprot:3128196-Pyramimonas_sp.AAC.1
MDVLGSQGRVSCGRFIVVGPLLYCLDEGRYQPLQCFLWPSWRPVGAPTACKVSMGGEVREGCPGCKLPRAL